MKSLRSLGLVAFLAAAAITPVLAWGHTGHGITNRIAVDVLPEGPLKAFFKKHQEWVAKHSVDPDRYKGKHRADEGPRHYLDIDAAGTKPEDYPRTWKGCIEKWGLQRATKQGRLPWTIAETVDALVSAYKAGDGTLILSHAVWLGHYVGDAHQPFHACTNHDGADTGQKGIHSLFESAMLDHNEDAVAKAAVELAAKESVAVVATDSVTWAFEVLVTSDRLAHEILVLDNGPRSGGREKALFDAAGSIAEQRLADGAVALASLWLTAWEKAGKPALPAEVKLTDDVSEPPPRADETPPAPDPPEAH